MSKSIYLDYAAATPLDKRVRLAMEPYFSEKFYNPSATYLAGQSIKEDLDGARKAIAGWLGAKSSEIVFTAGATEANNLAIRGLMSRYPTAEIIVSAVEHESVLEPTKHYSCQVAPVKNDGTIDLGSLEKLVSDTTVLISIMMVNNELGTLQPLRDISSIIEQTRKKRQSQNNKLPIYFHTDAAQAPNFFDLHVQRLGVDLLSLNGGKMYGPKQSGILFVKSGVELEPLILGGGQERGLRSGTENVAAAIGLSVALDIAQKSRAKESKRLTDLRRAFISELTKLDSITINGSAKHQSPHILSVTFAGRDNERLMMELDEKGVQSAIGSACSASSIKPSHVLSSIGLSDEQARSTLRFSFGRQTSRRDIYKTVAIIRNLLS